MSIYGDPDELDRLAHRLRGEAAEVRRLAGSLSDRAHALEWRSAAAQAYRDTIADDRERLLRNATDLDSASELLREHAQVVRDRIAEIRHIESAARDWLGRQLTRIEGWPLDRLPAPGHADWLHAGTLLRTLGVL